MGWQCIYPPIIPAPHRDACVRMCGGVGHSVGRGARAKHRSLSTSLETGEYTCISLDNIVDAVRLGDRHIIHSTAAGVHCTTVCTVLLLAAAGSRRRGNNRCGALLLPTQSRPPQTGTGAGAHTIVGSLQSPLLTPRQD